MEFSKKLLIFQIFVSALLILTTVIGTLAGRDVTAIAVLAGGSILVDGGVAAMYFWKAKNENRSKYAQKFVKLFARDYGIDAAIRIAEVVLKE